jgi:hypothetical protein
MRLLATSRQYVIVPAVLLDAAPRVDPVDIAFTSGGADPGPGDWLPATWVASLAGQLLGAGLLVGPRAYVIAPGSYMIFVCEHLADGELQAWPWTRLRVGL